MTENATGCVVISVRDDKEFVVIDTPAGPISLQIRVLSPKRARAVIEAPKSLHIWRQKREGVANDAV